MNDNDYKKIADLVDERVNKSLEPFKSDFTELKHDLTELKHDLRDVKDTQTELKQNLRDVKDTQEERVLPTVTEIEVTIKSYADSYKINKGNIERLDSRLTTVEDKLEIQPSDQLAIQR